MPSAMVDFVFSERLFVVFLINGCDDKSPENKVLQDLESSYPGITQLQTDDGGRIQII